MQVLKLKIKAPSKVDLCNLLLQTYCLFSDIQASKTELLVLSYISVYGFKDSTKDLVLKSQILKSKNSLENTITRLRKLGLLERTPEGKTVLKKEINVPIETKMGALIQIEL